MTDIDKTLQHLAEAAWHVRDNAHIVGKTKVGCAVLAQSGEIFVGCNVEHIYRCHDVHAEINAITSMISGGQKDLNAVVIVAERDLFTPCGGCLDWIFQFGGGNCLVASQSKRDGPLQRYTAQQLMPFYPR